MSSRALAVCRAGDHAQLLRFALDGIASFTTIPLRVWSYLGLVISFMALCYAMFILVKTLIFGADVPGFPTLIISVMFFAGCS